MVISQPDPPQTGAQTLIPVLQATAVAPASVDVLQRACAFAQPLIDCELLDTAENVWEHAQASAAILADIGGSVDIGKGKATIRMKPGEYIRVNGAGDQLRNAIVPYQHPGPSAVSMPSRAMPIWSSPRRTSSWFIQRA